MEFMVKKSRDSYLRMLVVLHVVLKHWIWSLKAREIEERVQAASVRLGISLSPGSGKFLEMSCVRYHENGMIDSFSHLSTYARFVRES